MHVLIALVCTETAQNYTPMDSPIHRGENLCFLFVPQMLCELWALIYDAVEIILMQNAMAE